ncbi:MAG: bifunctional riboflavin kinase/FMN adenylyltransferase, partial [Spirochaetes bacterium]|nr:bifunctional riboflavin kinase/FMN adenylyltransferase [Spirochaetota bacterium]
MTIGAFDGVHLGHRRLIDLVRSREPKAESAVVT